MNEFEYVVKAEEIKRATLLTWLKKQISKYYSIANCHYMAHYDLDTYNETTDVTLLATKLKALELFKLAKDRYVELGGDICKLPKFAVNWGFSVNVTMSLQDAHDWIKYKQK